MTSVVIPILITDSSLTGTYDAGLDVAFTGTVDASFSASFSASNLNGYFKYSASTVNGAVTVDSVTYTADSIVAGHWSTALADIVAALPAKIRSAAGLPATSGVSTSKDATAIAASINTSFKNAGADQLLSIAKQKPSASWVAGSNQNFVGFAAGDTVKLYIQFSGPAPTAGGALLSPIANFSRSYKTASPTSIAPFVYALDLTLA